MHVRSGFGFVRREATPASRAGRLAVAAIAATVLAACGANASGTAPSDPGAATAAFAVEPSGAIAGRAFRAVVAVTDARGRGVADTKVTLSLDGGTVGATLSGTATAMTDPSGIATLDGLSVAKAGTGYSLVATAGAIRGSSRRFDVVPGPPSIGVGGSSTLTGPGGPVAPCPSATAILKATILDAFANPIQGRAVSFSSNGGVLSAPAAMTDVDGVASVSVASSSAGSLSITASVLEGTVGVASVDFEPGPAARLAFAAQPAAITAGETLSPAVEVTAQDACGNPVSSFTGPVMLSLSDGAALLGTVSAALSGQAATFADLSIQKAGRFTLTASADGVSSAASDPFDVRPASPSMTLSTFAANPATLDVSASATLTATVQDLYGNPVPGVVVAFAATGAANLLVQPASPTDGDGVATGRLGSTRPEVKTLTATAGAAQLSSHPSVTFRPGPPSAARSTLTAAPGSVPADGTPVTLTALVVDAYDNAAPGVTVSFVSSRGTVVPASAQTDPTGLVTAMLSSPVTGSALVNVVIGGSLRGPLNVAFTSPPPADSMSTVRVFPAIVPADGTSAGTVRVVARDRLGRPIPGAPVTLAQTGSAAVAPGAAITNADGVATFAIRSSNVGSSILEATVDTGSSPVLLSQRATVAFSGAARGLGGTVLGLRKAGLVLGSPGLDDLAVPAGARTFAFSAQPAPGATYDVSVKSSPAGHTCGVLRGSGTAGPAGVVDVVVRCVPLWKQVAVGSGHSLGLTTAGDLYAWGDNAHGQLGDGTTERRYAPVLIGTGYASVAAGPEHSLAVTDAGELHAWGANGSGQLGDGTSTERRLPVSVGTGFASVAAGRAHSLGVTSGGDLYAWGANDHGQLGDGTTTGRFTPVFVGTSVAAATAGTWHSLAVKTNGDLYAWGATGAGQLGDGTTTDHPSAVLVGKGFGSVAAGDGHTLGVMANGDLYAWGNNYYGQLGAGTWSGFPAFLFVGSGFASVAATEHQSRAVKANGELYAWGRGDRGQVGAGTLGSRVTPALLGTGFVAVSVGPGHSLAVTADHELFAWGAAGESGLLGSWPDSIVRFVPTEIAQGFVAVSAGENHTLALTAGGDLYAWGGNEYGQVGDGTSVARHEPVRVGSGFSAVAAGSLFSLGLTTGGDLYAWGLNNWGQLGDGSTLDRYSPVLVGSGYIAIAAGPYHALGLSANGDVWAWGLTVYGDTGDNSVTAHNSPVHLGSQFRAIGAGRYSSLGVKTNGDLYALGTAVGTPPRTDPVLIGTGFASVSGGSSATHALAVKTNGDLYAWGSNTAGQLGDGTTVDRPAPVFIGSGFASASAGGYCHSLGVRSNGDLYAWGCNPYGQLGDGTPTNRLTPTLVGTGFASVSGGGRHSLALTPRGELYGWGLNFQGELTGVWASAGSFRAVLTPARTVARLPDAFGYSTPVWTITTGAPVTPNLPAFVVDDQAYIRNLDPSAIDDVVFSVTPALPAGLFLDPWSGVVSGTPTQPSPARSYAVTAAGPTSSTTTLLTITVN